MPEEKKKIKFGVVGAGKIGTYHVRTLSKMPDVELVGVCDSDSMRAQSLAWKHNCVAYTNQDDLLSQVEAIVIAVPTEHHKQVGMAALNRGIHCLVEKPIASSMDEARELLKASESKDVVFQVGHSERFNPAVTEAFKHIKSPRFIVIERAGPYDPRMSAIGVILDLMIHDIDLLLTLMDSPIMSFEAVGASIFSKHEDIANVRMRFKNGCIADVTASRASMERARYMRVYQESAYVSVDFMNARVKLYKKKNPVVASLKDVDVIYPPVAKQQPIAAEITHFIDCINHMKIPWPSGERGSRALHYALEFTERLARYELNRAANPEPQGPVQVASDIGKAAQVAISEALGTIGLDKS
ncbi:MAG: Gfo/Idh/MocA family oxidoreductase [Elusimicrobiales bacterium]